MLCLWRGRLEAMCGLFPVLLMSQTIMSHPVLREFELRLINDEATITSVINIICSRGFQGGEIGGR